MPQVFYSPSYVRSAHAFDTTRKAQWVADSLRARPIPGITLQEPRPLTEAQLALVHDPEYASAVRTGQPRPLAESQGFPWDIGLWEMVLATNGGAVEAALAALRTGRAGSLSSGLHHARKERGAGFCSFNGLALAATAALAATGAGSVLILDLDAHCGGGTVELTADDPRVWHCDISTSNFDDYQPSARQSLDVVTSANVYLPTVRNRLDNLEHLAPVFDLCIYNAGMDPHEDSAGGLHGIRTEMLAERERLVFDWCRQRGVPVAFVLAGGYLSRTLDQDDLAACFAGNRGVRLAFSPAC